MYKNMKEQEKAIENIKMVASAYGAELRCTIDEKYLTPNQQEIFDKFKEAIGPFSVRRPSPR